MQQPKKLAESLRILCQHGQGLLSALYNASHMLNPDDFATLDSLYGDGSARTSTPRAECPRLFTDSAFAAVSKAVLKKFPEQPDLAKVNGGQALSSDAKNIQAELQPYYALVVDSMEFVESAIATLLGCDKLAGMNYGSHHLILDDVMLLISLVFYVQVMLDNNLGSQRKLLVGVVNLLNVQLHGGQDSSFARICSHIQVYEKPIQALQDQLAPLNPFLGTLMASVTPDLLKFTFMTMEQIRKDASFAIVQNMKATPADDQKLKVLSNFQQHSVNLVVLGMLAPLELLKQPMTMEAIKLVSSNNLLLPVFRTEAINLSNEFEAAIKGNSKVSKLKGLVSDSYGSGIQKAIQFHQSRRDYVRYCIKQYSLIAADSSFVLSMKMPAIEAILKLASEELNWYFMHHDKTIGVKVPKSLPKAPATQQWHDPAVFELMDAILQLKQLISDKKAEVSSYYITQFSSVYASQLEALSEKIKTQPQCNDQNQQLLSYIIKDVKDISDKVNLQGLRVNIQRFFVLVFAYNAYLQGPIANDFIALLNEVYVRSRYVDRLDETIEEAGSLKQTYYHRLLLQEQFADVVTTDPLHIQYLHSMGKVTADFTKNASPMYAKEYSRIAHRAMVYAQDLFLYLGRAAAQYTHSVILVRLADNNQLLDENAAQNVPDKRDKKKRDTKAPSLKPGQESSFQVNKSDTLPNYHSALTNCVRSLQKSDSVVVHDVQFSPMQFAAEALTAKLKSFFSELVFTEEAAGTQHKDGADEPPFNIKKPSQFYNEIQAIMDVVESYFGHSVDNVVRDALLEQIDVQVAKKQMSECDAAVAKAGNQKRGKKPPTYAGTQPNQTFLTSYVNWYTEYVRDRVAYGVALENSAKKIITSTAQSSFKAQLYTDKLELIALAKLLGPSGVRLLDERLLTVVYSNVKDLKELLMSNVDALQFLQRYWFQEGKFEEGAKKLKGFEDFLQKSINAGFVLKFRSNLFEALQLVTSSRTPALVNVAHNANSRYPANTYGKPEYMQADVVANLVGMFDRVDVQGRQAMQPLCRNPQVDQKAHSLLPYAFSAAFRSLALEDKTSLYNSTTNGLDNNGHCIAETVHLMLESLVSLSNPNEPDALRFMFREFVQTSATILMKLHDNMHADAIKSAYVVLMQLCQRSQFLDGDTLETIFPYSVARSCYGEFTRRGVQSKRKVQMKTTQDDEVVQ